MAGEARYRSGLQPLSWFAWPARRAGAAHLGWCEVAALVMLAVFVCQVPLTGLVTMSQVPDASDRWRWRDVSRDGTATGESYFAGYVGNPIYYRSNVHLVRPDGTDLVLKGLGWDGDALYFPIDGGVRWVKWGGRGGFMIDFLHNKAIARLGRGAHGRRLKAAVVEEVPVEGKLKGQPAPSRMRLTDLFDRLEFTHGHNMLFATGLLRMAEIAPGMTPYAGLGGGFALPHTEVWFKGEPREHRTNEYQFAGPAAQMVAGLEIRAGRVAYFIEYKFSYAWIWGGLTADKSWKNWNMPGDLWRQFNRWMRGQSPRFGRFYTTLGAHQINVGVGYRWPGKVPPK